VHESCVASVSAMSGLASWLPISLNSTVGTITRSSITRLGCVLINARAMSAFGVIADVAWASRNVR
jgi:hypothetical protein